MGKSGGSVSALVLSLALLFPGISSIHLTAQTVTGEVPHPTPMQAVQTHTGMTARNDREVLDVTVCGDSVIHVVARPVQAPAPDAPRPWMRANAQACPGAPFQFSQSGNQAVLTTARLTVSLSAEQGSLTFKTLQGERLVQEYPNLARTYLPSEAKGLYHIEDRYLPDATEAIYGLGQHQSGLFNYRGSTVELGQNNTDIAIPLLVSSKGYAIFWNSAAFSYVDNRFPLNLNFESMAHTEIMACTCSSCRVFNSAGTSV